MSYTITVKCTSKATRDKLFDKLFTISPLWKQSYSDLIKEGDDQIGFCYSPMSGWERVYIYTVIGWLALKFGVRDSDFSNSDTKLPEGFPTNLPYYLYEGDEMPLIEVEGPTSDYIGVGITPINKLGIRMSPGYRLDLVLEQAIYTNDPDWERLLQTLPHRPKSEKKIIIWSKAYRVLVFGYKPFQDIVTSKLAELQKFMSRLDNEF